MKKIIKQRKLRALQLEVISKGRGARETRAALTLTDDDLTTLQQFVGGQIDDVRFDQDAVMIVNDEGLLIGLPTNGIASILARRHIVGNAWIFGVDSDGELYDVPDRYLSKVLDIMMFGR